MSFSAVAADKPVVLEIPTPAANTAASTQPKEAPETLNGRNVTPLPLPPASHNQTQTAAKVGGGCSISLISALFIAAIVMWDSCNPDAD